MNKKAATALAVGVILLTAVIFGFSVWVGNKKNHYTNSCPTAPRVCADGARINLAMPNCNQACPEDEQPLDSVDQNDSAANQEN